MNNNQTVYETVRHGVTGCHTCPFTAELAAMKHRDLAYEDSPCFGCRAADRAGFVLEYDEGRGKPDPETDEGDLDETHGEPELATAATDSGEDMMPVDVLAQILKGLLMLPAVERDTVALRYIGMKFREISEAQGVTVSCCEKRVRTAMKRWPALRELFAEKAAKQGRRKPHGHKSAASGIKQGVTGANRGKTARKQGAAASRIRLGRRLR
jgi:hypothetical protein